MEFAEEFEFGHEDRKRIYRYVEQRGAVGADEVQDGLSIDPGGFRHHVAILRRDGYLEEIDGDLRAALEAGEREEFTTPSVEFAIRPARQEDLGGVVGAIRQVVAEKTYIVAESVADEIDHENALLRHNDLESRVFFVATVEEGEARSPSETRNVSEDASESSSGVDPRDEVVGWVHLRAPELDKLSHTAELTVGVLDGYRRQGIGSHLLERGLEWAAANGYEKGYQSVPSTNELAIEFLEGHGWETEAVREDHYKLDGEYVNEVMMAVEL